MNTPEPIRLRIVSDGTVAGTRVVDTLTGRELSNCTLASWTMASDDHGSEAVISLWGLEADVCGTLGVAVTDDGVSTVFPSEDNVLSFADFKTRE